MGKSAQPEERRFVYLTTAIGLELVYIIQVTRSIWNHLCFCSPLFIGSVPYHRTRPASHNACCTPHTLLPKSYLGGGVFGIKYTCSLWAKTTMGLREYPKAHSGQENRHEALHGSPRDFVHWFGEALDGKDEFNYSHHRDQPFVRLPKCDTLSSVH